MSATGCPSVAGTVRYRFIVATHGEVLIGDTSAAVSVVAKLKPSGAAPVNAAESQHSTSAVVPKP